MTDAMRWLLGGSCAIAVAATALIGAGCNNACQQSIDRRTECLGDRGYDAGPVPDCAGVTECNAQCIDDANCDDVVAFVHGDGGTGKIADCNRQCAAPTPLPQ